MGGWQAAQAASHRCLMGFYSSGSHRELLSRKQRSAEPRALRVNRLSAVLMARAGCASRLVVSDLDLELTAAAWLCRISWFISVWWFNGFLNLLLGCWSTRLGACSAPLSWPSCSQAWETPTLTRGNNRQGWVQGNVLPVPAPSTSHSLQRGDLLWVCGWTGEGTRAALPPGWWQSMGHPCTWLPEG